MLRFDAAASDGDQIPGLPAGLPGLGDQPGQADRRDPAELICRDRDARAGELCRAVCGCLFGSGCHRVRGVPEGDLDRLGPLARNSGDPCSGPGLLPDVVVLRADDRATLDRLPVLVVEVLSPSTHGRDQIDKRRLYARRGIASYWLVDSRRPSVRILELGTKGEYVEVANAFGDEAVELVHPFPVSLVPDELLR